MDSHTNDDTVSEGCCLAVIKIILRSLRCSFANLMIGMMLPKGDFKLDSKRLPI